MLKLRRIATWGMPCSQVVPVVLRFNCDAHPYQRSNRSNCWLLPHSILPLIRYVTLWP